MKIISFQEIKEISTQTYREWRSDGTLRLGASIAYYGIIAVIPLIVIMLVLALIIFSPQQIVNSVADLTQDVFSDRIIDTTEIKQINQENIDRDSAGINGNFGIFGLISFIITASLFMVALQDALNFIWRSRDKLIKLSFKNYVLRYLLAFTVMILGALLFSVVIGAQSFLRILENILPNNTVLMDIGFNLLSLTLFLSVLTLLFLLLTKFLVKVKIDNKSLLISSFITAIMMYIGVYAIAIYIGRFANFSYYGALSGFLIILIAMYYFAQIYLIGTELGKVIAYRKGNPHLAKFMKQTDPRIKVKSK